jgi:HmuY protein
MSLRKKTRFTLLPLTLGLLSACGGDGNTDPAANNTTQPAIAALQVAATAGGYGAAANDPANKYTYVNLDRTEIIDLSDEQAERSGAWHIAFKRTNIKLNGGVSGPGAVQGALADGQDSFYDANGDADSSVFLNANADSELTSFESATDSSALTFSKDRNVPYIKGDGSNNGWWLYSGAPTYSVSANPDQWWLIKSASADSYAKFHVSNIVQSSRDISLEFYIQAKTDSAFSNTLSLWTANIGSAGGSRCFDIDTVMAVDCDADSWDIKVEVAGQSWNIWTNGGVSGTALAGAFGPFDPSTAATYISGTLSPGGTNITRMYGQDSAGGLFKDNSWYAYGLQGASKLWPNYRVYAVDTGNSVHKLQILSYYDQSGMSANYNLRHADIEGQSRAQQIAVDLNEWAISTDKNTVPAGPVNFNITNSGPADAHEFVIIKTDLGVKNLPVDINGKVDENAAGITIIGELENISVNADAKTTFQLEPGNYVLICNIWDAAENEAHYSQGMRSIFTVQ